MKERKLKQTSIIYNKIVNDENDENIKLKDAIFNLKDKENAPIYSADSPYILTGFRQPLNVIDCLKSIFFLHNQTFNIWTAIILVGYNLYLGYHFTINENMPASILIFFWIHSILRSICWINSFLYHTFVCYSKDIANLLCTLDYIGCYLTPLGMGSNFIYLQYYCNPIFAYVIIPTGFIIIIIAILMSMLPFYQKEEYRKIRAAITLISIIPYIIGVVLALFFIHDVIPSSYSTLCYAFIIEIIAGSFYVTMFPEILFPKCCDILASSHLIWHIVNFGFDTLMMLACYESFKHLETQMCYTNNT